MKERGPTSLNCLESPAAPRHREPGLLMARAARRPVVGIDLAEPRGCAELTPALDLEVTAVALTRPAFLVVATRVREEQHAVGNERLAQLAEHARELRARYVKQRCVREDAVERCAR